MTKAINNVTPVGKHLDPPSENLTIFHFTSLLLVKNKDNRFLISDKRKFVVYQIVSPFSTIASAIYNVGFFGSLEFSLKAGLYYTQNIHIVDVMQF